MHDPRASTSQPPERGSLPTRTARNVTFHPCSKEDGWTFKTGSESARMQGDSCPSRLHAPKYDDAISKAHSGRLDLKARHAVLPGVSGRQHEQKQWGGGEVRGN